MEEALQKIQELKEKYAMNEEALEWIASTENRIKTGFYKEPMGAIPSLEYALFLSF